MIVKCMVFLAVWGVIVFFVGRTANGKGAGAAVFGLLMYLFAAICEVIAILLFVFWLGIQYAK